MQKLLFYKIIFFALIGSSMKAMDNDRHIFNRLNDLNDSFSYQTATQSPEDDFDTIGLPTVTNTPINNADIDQTNDSQILANTNSLTNHTANAFVQNERHYQNAADDFDIINFLTTNDDTEPNGNLFPQSPANTNALPKTTTTFTLPAENAKAPFAPTSSYNAIDLTQDEGTTQPIPNKQVVEQNSNNHKFYWVCPYSGCLTKLHGNQTLVSFFNAIKKHSKNYHRTDYSEPISTVNFEQELLPSILIDLKNRYPQEFFNSRILSQLFSNLFDNISDSSEKNILSSNTTRPINSQQTTSSMITDDIDEINNEDDLPVEPASKKAKLNDLDEVAPLLFTLSRMSSLQEINSGNSTPTTNSDENQNDKKRKREDLTTLKKYYYYCPNCNHLIQNDIRWGYFKLAFKNHFTRYKTCRKKLSAPDLDIFLKENKKSFRNEEVFKKEAKNPRFQHPCIDSNCCINLFGFHASEFRLLIRNLDRHCIKFHPHITLEQIYEVVKDKYPAEVANLKNFRNARAIAKKQMPIEQSNTSMDEQDYIFNLLSSSYQ